MSGDKEPSVTHHTNRKGKILTFGGVGLLLFGSIANYIRQQIDTTTKIPPATSTPEGGQGRGKEEGSVDKRKQVNVPTPRMVGNTWIYNYGNRKKDAQAFAASENAEGRNARFVVADPINGIPAVYFVYVSVEGSPPPSGTPGITTGTDGGPVSTPTPTPPPVNVEGEGTPSVDVVTDPKKNHIQPPRGAGEYVGVLSRFRNESALQGHIATWKNEYIFHRDPNDRLVLHAWWKKVQSQKK